MDNDQEVTVTIPVKKYHKLLASQRVLNALEDWGVDNWEGYGEAMSQIYYEDNKGE